MSPRLKGSVEQIGVVTNPTGRLRWVRRHTQHGSAGFTLVLQQEWVWQTGERVWEDVPTLDEV